MTMRQQLYKLTDNALGDRLRLLFNHNPPRVMRPLRGQSTVSDIIPWRKDGTWQTRFEVMNLPSLLDPQTAADDTADVLVMDDKGRTLTTVSLKLAPFTAAAVDFSEIDTGSAIAGTFACFHRPIDGASPATQPSHLCERGYVAFRHSDDSIWNYVHGNFTALAAPGAFSAPEILQGWRRAPISYRPQLDFSDCRSFELCLTNPTRTNQQVKILGRDASGKPVIERMAEISPKGCVLVDFDNANTEITHVECIGRPLMWRPVVFKTYNTHFDVFHG